jgi:hypothetical protein
MVTMCTAFGWRPMELLCLWRRPEQMRSLYQQIRNGRQSCGNPNQYSGLQMGGPFYPSIPAANVANITAGYNAQQNEAPCHE